MLQKLARVPGALRSLRGAELAYRIAVVALLGVGVYFRSRRYWFDPIGLWVDEASWARRMFKHSLTNFEFRPLGFMDATQLLVHGYSSEQTLRILSYLGGLASLVIAFDVGRHVFRSRTARVLCVAVVAFHPLLIDMSREFKPYSLELSAHLGLIWLYLRWRASGARSWFYALLSCSVLAFLFAYNIVFLLPAIFGLLAVTFLREKALRSLWVTVAAALLTLALIAGVWFGILRNMGGTDDSEKFWGGKYDVFYLPDGGGRGEVPRSHSGWLAHKYLDLAVFPDAERDKWVFPESVTPRVSAMLTRSDYYAWLVLHALGLMALLLRGRRQLFVLLVSPLVVVMAFNWLGQWPFGVFRANTFLLAYYVLIPLVGLDALVVWARKFGSIPAAAGGALVLLPALTVGFDAHDKKHFFAGHTEMPTVLRRLKQVRDAAPPEARAEKAYVLFEWSSCPTFEFYAHYNDSTRGEFGSYLLDNFEFQCTRSARDLRGFLQRLKGKPLFVVVTDYRLRASTSTLMHRVTHVLVEEQIRDTHDLYYAVSE